MGKVSYVEKRKKEQKFLEKGPSCSNCKSFDIPKSNARFGLRCTIGNFRVGKSNYCSLHQFKKADEKI